MLLEAIKEDFAKFLNAMCFNEFNIFKRIKSKLQNYRNSEFYLKL